MNNIAVQLTPNIIKEILFAGYYLAPNTNLRFPARLEEIEHDKWVRLIEFEGFLQYKFLRETNTEKEKERGAIEEANAILMKR